MKLKAYLDREGLTPQAFGKTIGLGCNTIYRYLRGERVPAEKITLLIASATGGEVTWADFVEHKHERQKRAA